MKNNNYLLRELSVMRKVLSVIYAAFAATIFSLTGMFLQRGFVAAAEKAESIRSFQDHGSSYLEQVQTKSESYYELLVLALILLLALFFLKRFITYVKRLNVDHWTERVGAPWRKSLWHPLLLLAMPAMTAALALLYTHVIEGPPTDNHWWLLGGGYAVFLALLFGTDKTRVPAVERQDEGIDE